MKSRRQLLRIVPAITAFALAAVLGSAQCFAQNAYVLGGVLPPGPPQFPLRPTSW